MKQLILMRHAKSDWSAPGQKDFDRGLNRRGHNNAPLMGIKLKELGLKPQLVVSSPALRAMTTAKYVAEQIAYEPDDIVLNDEIYEASTRTLLREINQFDDAYDVILVFGHNPSFSYLAEYLTKAVIGNIPTAGAVAIEFDLESWTMLSEGTGQLKWFVYPKMYDEIESGEE